MRPPDWRVLITCEHGGNRVPDEYAPLFVGMDAALASHRGWDPGALALARWLGTRLGARVIASTTTRLLVDLNRSTHNPRVFSEATRRLPRAERRRLLARFHAPHRDEVAEAVAAAAEDGRAVLHLSVHSFTPELRGQVRRADVALLYDPSRASERALCAAWTKALRGLLPGRLVRRNHPYRGRSDGLTTSLRAAHGEDRYLGIEIEVNQKHVDPDGAFPSWVGEALAGGLEEALAGGLEEALAGGLEEALADGLEEALADGLEEA